MTIASTKGRSEFDGLGDVDGFNERLSGDK